MRLNDLMQLQVEVEMPTKGNCKTQNQKLKWNQENASMQRNDVDDDENQNGMLGHEYSQYSTEHRNNQHQKIQIEIKNQIDFEIL